MAELINPITGEWDVELLQQTFWEDDVEIIRSIVVHIDMDDVLAWHFDIREIFSVKSAYKVHREHTENRQKGCGILCSEWQARG